MSTSFNRTAVLNVGSQVSIDVDNLTMYFDVEFDDDTKPNESVIEVYNLSNSTISRLKRNEKLTLTAGYRSDGRGVILSSRISSVRSPREGVDRVTRITVIDGPDLSAKKSKKKTYAKNVRALTIVRDLIPGLGLAVGKVQLVKNPAFKKGYTVNENIVDELEKLAKTCGVSFFVHKQRVYFAPVSAVATKTSFVLSSETGLIGSPEPYEMDGERGFKVKCLLQYRIGVGSLITIKSRTANGTFRVKRGRHYYEGSNFMTETEVVKA